MTHAKDPTTPLDAVHLDAAFCGYAKIENHEYKLVSMKDNPVMADGELHPVYTFSNEMIERLHATQAQAQATPAAAGEVTQRMIDAAEQVEDLYRRGSPDTWGKVYRAMRAAAPTQPQAAPAAAEWKLLEDGVTAIPEDWTPLRLEWEPGYPEDVAFGPTHLMERLKKWLDSYFAIRAATQAQAAPVVAQPAAQAELTEAEIAALWGRPARFVARVDGRSIGDDDFTHDAHLDVHGDFADDASRKAFADGLCALLNATQAQAAPAAQVADKQSLLMKALERMDRARDILTDRKPTPNCHWGMLDTSDLRAALTGAPSFTAAPQAAPAAAGYTLEQIAGAAVYAEISDSRLQALSIALSELFDGLEPTPAPADLPGSMPRAISDFPALQAEIRAAVERGELSVSGDAPAAQVAENAPVGKMTARRAVYFLERFKHDEKMLGPNEQAGLDYAIATLEREQAAALGDPRFSWMDFQEIGELTAVDEAIRNMLNDQTEDNGVCMIRAICEAAADRLVALAARHRAFPAPMLYQQMALAKALHATSVDPDEWDALRQCEIDALRDRAVKIMTLLAT